MLHCETGDSLRDRDLMEWHGERAGTFALIANYYTAARAQQDRSLLRDMLGQIIGNLHDQFQAEARMLWRIRDSSVQARERMYTHLLVELREFLDLFESEDEPLTKLAHALDGLVIRLFRGELRLLS